MITSYLGNKKLLFEGLRRILGFERKIKKMFEAAMNIFLKRGNQTMGPYQPDIATKEYWIECTHGAMPRVYSKIEQALRDLKHKRNVEHKDKIPLIVFQKDRQMIWVALPLWHFFQLRGYDREKKEEEQAEENVERNLKHYTEETCPTKKK